MQGTGSPKHTVDRKVSCLAFSIQCENVSENVPLAPDGNMAHKWWEDPLVAGHVLVGRAVNIKDLQDNISMVGAWV